MGIMFSCCIGVNDPPTDNSTLQNDSCLRTMLNKCKQLMYRNEFQPISSDPISPTISPEIAHDRHSNPIHLRINEQSVHRPSDSHVAASIPDTTQDDREVLYRETGTTSISRFTSSVGIQPSDRHVEVPVSTRAGVEISSSDETSKMPSSLNLDKPSSHEEEYFYQLREQFLPPDEEEECPTCLEEYNDDNPKIITECLHHYHLSCIYAWMERSNLCPICSRVMVFDEAT